MSSDSSYPCDSDSSRKETKASLVFELELRNEEAWLINLLSLGLEQGIS